MYADEKWSFWAPTAQSLTWLFVFGRDTRWWQVCSAHHNLLTTAGKYTCGKSTSHDREMLYEMTGWYTGLRHIRRNRLFADESINTGTTKYIILLYTQRVLHLKTYYIYARRSFLAHFKQPHINSLHFVQAFTSLHSHQSWNGQWRYISLESD